MPSLFIGVYVALYPYVAQTDQELSLNQGDLLYLLEKSTTDDWWKVKKRVLGSETEEPVGLVPNTYIQPAPVVSSAKALYSYDRQTEEELSFQEDDLFDVYDSSDPDWLLVGRKASQEYGFVPANYIEIGSGAPTSAPQSAYAAPPPSAAAPPSAANASTSTFGQGPKNSTYIPPPPPPTFVPPAKDKPLPEMPSRSSPPPSDNYGSSSSNRRNDENDEEDAPPLPSRPTNSDNGDGRRRQKDSSRGESSQNNKRNEQFYNWYVQEVDGRKKYKATLSIGNGSIMYSSARTDSNPQQWPIDDLINYNNEKKHVFLELQHPSLSLDLHAGSKETAEEIISVLGDLSGANKAIGLREVIAAAKSAGQKMGKVLYDFDAAHDDEVTVKEGENIFVIDSERSNEWWLIRNASGREGMIPSSYIEVAPEPTSSKRLSFYPSRQKSDGGNKKSLLRRPSIFTSSSSKKDREDREEREREAERERDYQRQQDARRRQRSQSNGGSSSGAGGSSRNREGRDGKDKPKPDPRKVRTWTDRSGAFKVDAAFLGCVDGKIHLHKVNGVKIAVAAGKMSTEDLEYVEHLTGMSFEDDKPLADIKRDSNRAGARRASSRGDDRSYSPSYRNRSQQQVLTIPGGVSTGDHDPDSFSPRTASRPADPVVSQTNAHSHVSQAPSTLPEFDWFGFFLDCGVDINNCQRYSINFNRDKMDESILADITPEVLRTLGLKEGDILRVTKRLDEKFNRRLEGQKTGGGPGGAAIVPVGTAAGGLFSNTDGTLKNNTTRQPAPNGAAATPAPIQAPAASVPSAAASTASLASQTQPAAQGFEDDAWAVRGGAPVAAAPAVAPAPAPIPAPAPVVIPAPAPAPVAVAAPVRPPAPPAPPAPVYTQPQPTGALKEFLDFKPLQPVPTEAAKTASIKQQMTGAAAPQVAQRTGGGSIITIPVTIPIALQPVATGALGAQATGGFVREPLNPFATGVAQQPFNVSTTSLPAQMTGVTSQFTGAFVAPQVTGGFVAPQVTGGLVQTQLTGVRPQATGGFVAPQVTGGIIQTQLTGARPQITGGFVAPQITGGLVATPTSNPFLTQQFAASTPALTGNPFLQGGAGVPQTTFGSAVPQTSFGQPQVASTAAPTLNTLSNQMQALNLQQQVQPQATTFQTFPQLQQPSFVTGSTPNLFLAQQPQQQPQTTFQQPLFQQQQQLPSAFPQFGAAAATQPAAGSGYQMTVQPLQTQPTGFGFGNSGSGPSNNVGNIFQAMAAGAPVGGGAPPPVAFGNSAPLQPTATGRRANLNAATPQNPFGF